MSAETAYTMLVSSLPYLGSLFEARYSVISHLKLERRLKALSPEDAKTLAMIESLMHWHHLHGLNDDLEFVKKARLVHDDLLDPVLKDIVRHRIELRTLVAALRRHHLGLSRPGEPGKWGGGRWVKMIERNWNEPGFGLQKTFPWIVEANRLLGEKNTLGLERLLLTEVWTEIGRRSQGHQFDFVAVVAYVLRWDVMERWTHYEADPAQRRFAQLVDETIGDAFTSSIQEFAHG